MYNSGYKIFFLFGLLVTFSCTSAKKTTPFKNTPANELARAVKRNDVSKIENLVKNDLSILKFTNPIDGSNALELSVKLKKFKAFKILLKLKSDPNFVNPITKKSILITSLEYSGSQFKWETDYRYAKKLLDYGANPNYITEQTGNNYAISALTLACRQDLASVKLLISYGADTRLKVGKKQKTSFSTAVSYGKVEIINYYIDSLGVDIFQPLAKVIRKPSNEMVNYYIQDYITNKYVKARLSEDQEELNKLRKQNKEIDKANEDLWTLILKLKSMGVDFENYDYK